MTEIRVNASKSYDILVGNGFCNDFGTLIKKTAGGTSAALVSDDRVWSLYGETVEMSLKSAGYKVHTFVFPNGEESKSPATYISLLEFLAENHITRSDIIVGLGGGVTGDLSGFAAATFQRGIGVVHIPTTLLAMVDSSVGGKTAINLEAGKNLAGAFYQPSLVLCDSAFLKTLPEDIFSDGMAEVIKYGVLQEPKILEWAENPHENIEKIITTCVKIKRDIVEEDERDTGLRQTLNLGHTIGHAIEAASDFKVSHGKAVAIGTAIISKAAEAHGDCEAGTHDKIVKALKTVSLPTNTRETPESLTKYMLSDKKRSSDTINLIIPKKIGLCEIMKIPTADLCGYISAGFDSVTLPNTPISGKIRAVPSKSYAHRLLICAALSQKPSKILCGGVSEDILATIDVLRGLGAEIDISEDGFYVKPINRENIPKNAVLNCRESGSTLRFLLPVACALGADAEFNMAGRLPERPLSPLYEELVKHGAVLSPQGRNPLAVSGKLTNPKFTISGDVSSQFISGLLFALPLMGGGSLEITGEIQSADYIEMTCDVLKTAGISITRSGNTINVTGGYAMPELTETEGDWSNAAFWLSAGAIGKNAMEIEGLNLNSLQGDRQVLDIIKAFGAEIETAENTVKVIPKPLHGITLDVSQIPDLVPALSILAAVAEGETRFTNAGRLRLKESDRISAIVRVMGALGADVREEADTIIFRVRKALSGGCVSSENDHRIAMMAGCASTICDGPVTIYNPGAVNKSYPAFFKDLQSLRKEEDQ